MPRWKMVQYPWCIELYGLFGWNIFYNGRCDERNLVSSMPRWNIFYSGRCDERKLVSFMPHWNNVTCRIHSGISMYSSRTYIK